MAQRETKIITSLDRGMDTEESEISIHRNSVANILSINQDKEQAVCVDASDAIDLVAGIAKVMEGSIYCDNADDFLNKVKEKLIGK